MQTRNDVINDLQLIRARADDEASGLPIADQLRVRRAHRGVVGEEVAVKLLHDGQHALRFRQPPQVEGLGLARRAGLRGERLDNLLDGARLLLGSEYCETPSVGVGINRRRLARPALRLLRVNALNRRQQLGGGGVLHVDGVQLAHALLRLAVERGNHRLDLRQNRCRREHDEPLAVRLRRDADQVRHRATGILRGENLHRQRGQRIRVAALHVDDLQLARLAGGCAADHRRVHSFVVETLDDVLGVLQVVARAGDDDAVRFAVERNSDTADGLIAVVELEHRVRDHANNLGRVRTDELEDARAARSFGRLIELLDHAGHGFQFVLRPADDEAIPRDVGDDLALRNVVRAAQILDEFGREAVRQSGDGRGITLLQLDDAHLARLDIGTRVELADDFRRRLDRRAVAGHHETVAPRIDEHFDLLRLGVETFLHEGRQFCGQRGFHADDARLFLRALAAGRIELADDRFHARNLFVRAADHDAVVLRLGEQGRRTTRRLGLSAQLFRVKLRDERREISGVAAKEFHTLELTWGSRGRRSIKLRDELLDAVKVRRHRQRDDLFPGRVCHELRRKQRIGSRIGGLL